MYRIYKNGKKLCSIEFGLMTPKKIKLWALRRLIHSFQNEISYVGGEICGIDFNVEKVSYNLNSKKILLERNQNEYATLYFLVHQKSDLELILEQFDRFSEGSYILYLFSAEVLHSVDEEIDLKKIGLKDFYVKITVYSDATYVEFDFRDELSCQKFIETNKNNQD